ncbi:hypothetical protein CDAR_230151 [Caerostris darwini]|uniref:Uncharacterized protein n=1 Tax=Caerostris darwini TaxID=1538125 RepID=A0AAV4MJG8_9ARAC|nr:hypothetical protein CDAR_230151 [Caerostris darwini]
MPEVYQHLLHTPFKDMAQRYSPLIGRLRSRSDLFQLPRVTSKCDLAKCAEKNYRSQKRQRFKSIFFMRYLKRLCMTSLFYVTYISEQESFRFTVSQRVNKEKPV